jgi:predicted N-acetyltransferase YhbS
MQAIPDAGQLIVENFPIEAVTPELVRGFVALSDLVWPTEESLAQKIEWTLEYLERIKREVGVTEQRDSDVVWHVIRDGTGILAEARSFRRFVATASGRKFRVLALAGVCTRPNQRKRGLAARIVTGAWSRLDESAPVSFFATTVPEFYAKLGARTVGNLTYNAEKVSGAFEPFAMIYPSEANWTDEAIDLLGPVW